MSNRVYDRELQNFGDLFTVADFEEMRQSGAIIPYDGVGYWVKDDKESRANVFETAKEDATHVMWYNK